MGSQAASTAESPVRIFWQDRPVKYKLNTGEKIYTVEEVKTAWDLFVEGALFGSEVGDELHQVMVREGMERIFSIRTDEGKPLCDIITKPVAAPSLDFTYGARRIFHTSTPMTVDGQKLIVLDVVGRRGNRPNDSIIKLARDFYLSQGGRLNEEHPNGLVYTDRKDVKRWRKIVDADVIVDLVISEKPLKEIDKRIRKDTFHATTLPMAKALLDRRFWDVCHIDGDMEWAGEVLDYIEADWDNRPQGIYVYGGGERSKAILQRAKDLYAKEKAK